MHLLLSGAGPQALPKLRHEGRAIPVGGRVRHAKTPVHAAVGARRGRRTGQGWAAGRTGRGGQSQGYCEKNETDSRYRDRRRCQYKASVTENY